MKKMLPLLAMLALPAFARDERHESFDQGAVRGHVFTAVAGLENARTSVRALTALLNDATAWQSDEARDLVKEARDGLAFSRSHIQRLRGTRPDKDEASQHLARFDQDVSEIDRILSGLRTPIARGVGPDQDNTRADHDLLGGAAADRDGPPGRGGDVTHNNVEGPRGGTAEVRSLRAQVKSAWDKLGEARSDLDRLARDYTAHTDLPNP